MKRLFLSLTLVLGTLLTFAQTAKEIIDKHIEATGGPDKWRALNSLYMEGVAVMQNGNEITSRISKINGKVLRREIDFGMGKAMMIVTPEKGWVANPRSGGNFEDMPAEMHKNQLLELDVAPLLDYEKKGAKAEFVGKDNIDGKEVLKVKLTPASGPEQTLYFDASSYYLLRVTFKAMRQGRGQNQQQQGPQETEVVVNYSNHDKTPEGYVFPYSISTGGMGGSMTFETLQVNPKLEEAKLLNRDKQ